MIFLANRYFKRDGNSEVRAENRRRPAVCTKFKQPRNNTLYSIVLQMTSVPGLLCALVSGIVPPLAFLL
jgi:hypothetical protein